MNHLFLQSLYFVKPQQKIIRNYNYSTSLSSLMYGGTMIKLYIKQGFESSSYCPCTLFNYFIHLENELSAFTKEYMVWLTNDGLVHRIRFPAVVAYKSIRDIHPFSRYECGYYFYGRNTLNKLLSY